MRHLTSALLATLIFAGCNQTSTPVSKTPKPASPQRAWNKKSLEQEPAKKKATAAFQEFSTQLKGELQKAIKLGGPVKAVEVCSEKAPQIAKELSEKHGFAMGRSSHRLRNPENAPADAIAAYLQKYSDKPAKDAVLEVSDAKSDWVVIAPIATQPLCLTCHGSPDAFSPELKSAMSKYYPEDKAIDFKAGDLRGVIWARLPKNSTDSSPQSSP